VLQTTHKIGYFGHTLPGCSLGTQEHQDILVSMLEKATEHNYHVCPA